MMITNDVEIAQHAIDSGVKRIFIDLEINGKFERQGHLDTLISKHSMLDVKKVKEAIPSCDLLVRINPYYDGSEKEIEEAVTSGADLIMLPMFKSVEEIKRVSQIIDGRVKFVPLVETVAATECLTDVVEVPGVSEIFIGLNDLHLDLGLKFMFQPLANGLVESMTKVIKKAGLPFGFGGIARMGEGTLPAEMILAEHKRLGSSSVILSRTFHRKSESVSDLMDSMCLKSEVNKILSELTKLQNRNSVEMSSDSMELVNIVNSIVVGE